MDDHTLDKLEFDRIRDILAGHCSCSLGKGLAGRITPSVHARQVKVWLAQAKEMSAAAETVGLPPMGGVHDIRGHLRGAGTPAGLDGDALAEVAETLAATGALRAWIASLGDQAPSLARFDERIGDFTVPAATIGEAVDPRGKVRDTASPKLANLRDTIDRARQQISTVFARLLRQSSTVRMLQYANATFHNDRMVLPLKSEHRGRIPGIIHRSSDTGATLFVEPAEAVELNNSIVRLRRDEQKEVGRILQGLSRLVHDNSPGIVRTLHAIAVLDLIAAKHRYARKRNCLCPEIRDDGVLYLQQARHPVLLEVLEPADGNGQHPVVPIDVRLGDDFDLLIVTGPNTGGKTAALKTIGLMALMAQSGIPIPVAAGSEMPVFRKVFIDVGDEQSLEQSLSTFSGHMSQILSILDRAGPQSLVLIDELGAGTDPDEGAAIGRAVIDHLLQAGAKTVATTHLSALKSIAFTHDRADNAAVEFDVESLEPTYHLRLGEPGNSNAIVVAERLGMPPRLVKQARSHLGDRHRQLQKAIEGTLQSRRRAESARREALQAKLEADQSRHEYEQQKRELTNEQEDYRRWIEWINRLQPGDTVFVASFDTDAKVVRMYLHKQTALVSSGALDIEVPLRELSEPTAEDDPATA